MEEKEITDVEIILNQISSEVMDFEVAEGVDKKEVDSILRKLEKLRIMILGEEKVETFEEEAKRIKEEGSTEPHTKP